MKRFKGCLGVFLIFLFGVVFGCAITAGVIHDKMLEIVEGGPDRVTDVMVNRLKKDLKLDKEQQEMLQQIAVETRIRLRNIRKETQPQVERTLAQAAERVRGILNPDQTRKFDEIIRKGYNKWKSGLAEHEAKKGNESSSPPPPAVPTGSSVGTPLPAEFTVPPAETP